MVQAQALGLAEVKVQDRTTTDPQTGMQFTFQGRGSVGSVSSDSSVDYADTDFQDYQGSDAEQSDGDGGCMIHDLDEGEDTGETWNKL